MTVLYNNKNHLLVIFKIRGSIWPEVLPSCIFNCLVTAVIWIMRDRGIADLHFDGGLGYQFISVLVSFFVVSNINTTYNRFWEARGFVGNALKAANMLASRAALYSSQSVSDKAQVWRNALKDRLIDLVTTSMYMIQNERASVVNLMQADGESKEDGDELFEKHGVSRSLVEETVHLVADEEKAGMRLAALVDAVILSNGKYLDAPLSVQERMELLGRVSVFTDAWQGLLKFSTTPIPFVTVQMGRTIIFAWVLFLPFAIISDQELNLYEAIMLVFLVTYGFMGLTLAEVEMHDPLGNDDNDIETDRYTKLTVDSIRDSLGSDGHSHGSFFSEAFQPSKHGDGYNSIA